jgi:acyl-CoA reductase-like NAD-dependent aldehyde dehydrogenase
VVSEIQFAKIQRLIEAGVREGATLVTRGPGRPEGLERGYDVRPTVFANVTPAMTIAREEIFGPVLSIMPYENEAQVVEMANDTVYGLAGYVQSGDLAHGRRVASELRAGQVNLNGAGRAAGQQRSQTGAAAVLTTSRSGGKDLLTGRPELVARIGVARRPAASGDGP